jgi:hypothetical protein
MYVLPSTHETTFHSHVNGKVQIMPPYSISYLLHLIMMQINLPLYQPNPQKEGRVKKIK